MDNVGSLALPLIFLVVLYMVLIRPQQKRQKQHQAMVGSLGVGDDVVTVGGLHGEVIDLSDTWMDLDVTGDKGVVLRVERTSLARVVREEVAVVDDETTA
ncbi:MAG: preprotein translocase subunit YajC [Nitriliruptor sp.]|uniref:preprotein translocase subunit YajC n=1 Tax=Nitriliruptor sp. TaxID=2448056 RepID=UPI0034A0A86B